MTAWCWGLWDAEVNIIDCAVLFLTRHDYVLCNAAWQNNPEEIAEVFKRVLQKDTWGLQQIVIACLTTSADQESKSNPYLKDKSNYEFFSEALCPAAHAMPSDANSPQTDTVSQGSP